jgi:hypothetical protein
MDPTVAARASSVFRIALEAMNLGDLGIKLANDRVARMRQRKAAPKMFERRLAMACFEMHTSQIEQSEGVVGMFIVLHQQQPQVSFQLSLTQGTILVSCVLDHDIRPSSSALLLANRGENLFVNAISPSQHWMIPKHPNVVDDR